MFKKNIDNVISVFTKTINDLVDIEESSELDKVDFKAKLDSATRDATRAKTIRVKLEKLFEES